MDIGRDGFAIAFTGKNRTVRSELETLALFLFLKGHTISMCWSMTIEIESRGEDEKGNVNPSACGE